MDSQPTFERATLEADMRTLAAEIRNQRERPEMKDAGGKEVVKEAIRAFPDLNGNRAGSQPQPTTAAQTADANSPLPAYAQSAPAEVKLEIEYLLDIALKKGLSTAMSESHKSNYFVQDAFHDALTGRLYPELKKQGVVK
jgi:hypothetical protein